MVAYRYGVLRGKWGPARRGVVLLLGTLVLVAALLLGIVVLDWCYLSSIDRGMQDVCSIMALAAAPDLLDQNLLLDANGPPIPNQDSARTAAIQRADDYRQRENAVIPATEQLEAADVLVRTGFVDDVTLMPPTLDPAPAEHNSVFVSCDRTTDGGHPVRYLLDLSGATAAVDVRAGALATLDNLVIGFRPETELASPVMPLAIQTAAWNAERTTDSNSNGIREMVLRFRAADTQQSQPLPAAANAALLFYNGTFDDQSLAVRLPQQIAQGVFPADLPPSGQLGPASPGVLLPVLAAQQADQGNAGTSAVLSAINNIVGKKRVFPLFREVTDVAPDGTGKAQIEGFAACTVLGAQIVDNRLTVTVEPCFLIHHTAWTVPPSDPNFPAGLQRNLYIYKLRLAR